MVVCIVDSHLIEESMQLCLVMEYMDGLPLNDIVEPRSVVVLLSFLDE